MEHLTQSVSWGSPVGIALFFAITGIGAGVFFWGLSKFLQAQKSLEKNKEE